MNAKPKRKALKVYRYLDYGSGVFLPILTSIILAIAFFVLTLSIFIADNLRSMTLMIVLAGGLIWAFAVYYIKRLVIHEDALEYHTIFKRVIVPWKNLSYLEVIESINEEGGISYKHYLWLNDHGLDMLDIGSIVHIEDKRNETGYFIDVDALLTTRFGQDLLHYAPHVIEKTRTKQARDEELYAQFEVEKAEYEQRTRQARTLSRATQPIHVYPLFRHRPLEFLMLALVYSLILFIGVGLLLGFINVQLNLSIQWLIICLLAAVISIVLGFWFESRTGLTVYESGLQYRVTLHLNVFIEWSELTQLDVTMSINPEVLNMVNLCLRDASIAPINVEQFVPIKRHHFRAKGAQTVIDVTHLLSTPFGQDLQTYAPHVIEAAREAEKRARAS